MGRHVSRRVTILLATLTLALGIPLGIVIAGHQFGDVPNSNPFHADISAIANAGVTSGCGGGNYCPDRYVTRAEMAAFMNRLGALASNKTPVVNATKLDGIDSTAFLPDGTPPVGTTIRGSYALGTDGEFSWESISFGVTLASAPTAHWLQQGDAPTANCPGSPTNPQAAEGHLCVYERSHGNDTGHLVFNPALGGGSANQWGAALIVYGVAAGDHWSYGTWAVTVPSGMASSDGSSGAGPVPPSVP